MTKAPDQKAEKVAATNRKARHEYAVLDSLETGIALTGTEVKSVRSGNLNLTDGYAVVKRGEVWLLGVHISPYDQGSYANVDPRRDRKLLLHKKEIRKLLGRAGEPGVTLIPLQVYFKNRVAKVLLGVCRGKRAYDKREDISRREVERDIRRQYAR
jgi:SsrA-binding protein